MVHFPTQLTEEEEALNQKYAKLRKKKKALTVLRHPKVEKQESVSESNKRPAEAAADATEQAKKLLKLGAITVNVDKKDQSTFKRKRTKDSDLKSPISFQPFSQEHDRTTTTEERTDNAFSARHHQKHSLYKSFVPQAASEHGDGLKGRPSGPRPGRRGDHAGTTHPPKRGKTVYVFGQGLCEELMRKVFTPVGVILNVSMEPEKNCSFVTFEKIESAEQAIEEINGSLVSGTRLSVSMARHQPSIENHAATATAATATAPSAAATNSNAGEATAASSSWSTLAQNSSQKGGYRDKRALVQYNVDEDIF